MKKKNTPQQLPLANKHKHIIILGVVIILLFFVGAFFFQKNHTLLPETAKTDMTKLRPDVKKKLAEQVKTFPLASTVRVPILMYHYVEYVKDKKDTIRQSLDVTPNTFDSQMKTLREAGYTFMTAKDLADVFSGAAHLPDKPVLITFDDGHWDLDTDILPILKKYNVKATAYIVSGFIGTNSDSLTSSQLSDVIQSGLVEIGAHTVDHASLKGQSLSLVNNEVIQSKKMIESEYHIHVYSFAYPYGSFDQQAIDAVKQAGFLTAVSTIPGINQNQFNKFFLYRLRPGYRTGQDLLNFLNQTTFNAY